MTKTHFEMRDEGGDLVQVLVAPKRVWIRLTDGRTALCVEMDVKKCFALMEALGSARVMAKDPETFL